MLPSSESCREIHRRNTWYAGLLVVPEGQEWQRGRSGVRRQVAPVSGAPTRPGDRL